MRAVKVRGRLAWGAEIIYACPMRRIVCLILLLSSTACLSFDEIQVGARARRYAIERPGTAGPHPLVFVLHGGKSGAGRTRRFTDYDELARKAGFIAVFPEAADGNWNDGRAAPGWSPGTREVDDVAFFDAMIDRFVAEGEADPSRIYVTGISNGGFMSLRLACERPKRFAAVVSVAASLAEPLAPSCEPATSIMIIHGDADKFVPYDGGAVAPMGSVDRGRAWGVPKTIELFKDKLGCTGTGTVGPQLDEVDDDETSVVRTYYGGCSRGADLELIRIFGGGHSWPGSSELLDSVVGNTSQEFRATDVSWGFLSTHIKP